MASGVRAHQQRAAPQPSGFPEWPSVAYPASRCTRSPLASGDDGVAAQTRLGKPGRTTERWKRSPNHLLLVAILGEVVQARVLAALQHEPPPFELTLAHTKRTREANVSWARPPECGAACVAGWQSDRRTCFIFLPKSSLYTELPFSSQPAPPTRTQPADAGATTPGWGVGAAPEMTVPCGPLYAPGTSTGLLSERLRPCRDLFT